MPFDAILTNEATQMSAIAATDASVKDREMGGAWTISNTQVEMRLENQIHHKR